MSSSPLELLRAHARQAPWNARGLAAHVTAVVDAAGLRPTNTSARAIPTARAIRFYVAEGLMDHPTGAGTTATYGYKHFLQLVSIKLRQRDGATLTIIKKEMGASTGDALERRVADALSSTLGAVALPPAAPSTALWQRIPVAEGIELHVREDSRGSYESAIVAMVEGVRAALGR